MKIIGRYQKVKQSKNIGRYQKVKQKKNLNTKKLD